MQPSIAELTNRFLDCPSEAIAGEVEPYDVLSAFRVEPRTAWGETLTVLKSLGVSGPMPMMPAEWAGSVQEHSAVQFLPMALGTYPQQVSDLANLLEKKENKTANAIPAAALTLLQKTASGAATANEAAAVFWNDGRRTEAIAAWKAMPDSAVKAFNLGMAYLASTNASASIPQLKMAVSMLPEESGWRALASLYLALAESELSATSAKVRS